MRRKRKETASRELGVEECKHTLGGEVQKKIEHMEDVCLCPEQTDGSVLCRNQVNSVVPAPLVSIHPK